MLVTSRIRTFVVLASIAFACAATAAACSDDTSINPAGVHPEAGADAQLDAQPDGPAGDSSPTGTVKVRVLAINDFHGNLEAQAGGSGNVTAKPSDPQLQGVDAGGFADAGFGNVFVKAGGAVFLSTHLKSLTQGAPNTVIVSAGDLSGASPLVSNIFHDEPAVRVMNEIGLDFNGVGNHEFDRGSTELLRLQNGGCHPVDGCVPGETSFPGAKFHYLAANVNQANLATLFRPYEIKTFEGEQIAFIGMTLEDMKDVVPAPAIAGLTFGNEAKTVAALLPELKMKGVAAIVVLLHQGGVPTNGSTYADCNISSGPFFDLMTALPPEVDVVVSAHTHQAYVCPMKSGGLLVTSAASFGRVVTELDLEIDHATHKLSKKAARNVIVTKNVAADPAVDAIVQKYATAAAPIGNRVVGHITADLQNAVTASGETIMGDVIADAQLAAASGAGFNAVVAFMNPGGIRSDIVFTGPAGIVTYKSAFTVQPFSNLLTVQDLKGQDIKDVLEQQFSAARTFILQVPDSLRYTYTAGSAFGSKVDVASITINGVPLDLAATYRVVVNNFLAGGGDGFPSLAKGTNKTTAAIDLDALLTYFAAHDPLTPPAANRITAK